MFASNFKRPSLVRRDMRSSVSGLCGCCGCWAPPFLVRRNWSCTGTWQVKVRVWAPRLPQTCRVTVGRPPSSSQHSKSWAAPRREEKEEARNPVRVEHGYSPKRLGEKGKATLDRDRRTEMRVRLSNLNSVEMERCSPKRVRVQSRPIKR